MTDGTESQGDLEGRRRAATDAIRTAVMRRLQEGEVHPQLVVLAVA